MATLDTSFYTTSTPEAQHEGVIAAVYHVSLSISLSVGDTHRIGKIPHGAIPLDAVLIGGSACTGTSVAKFGTSASVELFFASATYSTATVRATARLGSTMQISLSDDRMPRYEAVVMIGSGSGTALSVGWMYDLIVYYRMPGQTMNP